MIWLIAAIQMFSASLLAVENAVVAPGPMSMRLPVPEVEKLSNGLTLVWFLGEKIPVIDLALMVKSGYRDDPMGKSGTTELTSSLLDRGSGGQSAQAIARAVESLGASRYASSDEDSFSIGVHGLAPDASQLLELLALIALKPDFLEPEFKREQARTLDRWGHIGENADWLAALTYRRVVMGGTEYGRGSFVSASEFAKVKREDVVAYHQTHFVPSNSILMVVGRVDRAAFRAKILEKFGEPAWTGPATPARSGRRPYSYDRLKLNRGQVLIVDRQGLTQAEVRMGFRAPPFQSPDHYALVVANALLGEYFNSRLNSLVRDKLGLTYSIGSGFSYSRDMGVFTISTAGKNETVGQLIRKSVEVLKDLRKGPIPTAEVNMAKEYLVGGFPVSNSTLGAVAARWLGGHVLDLGPEFLNEFMPKVSKIEPPDVIAAVAKHLDAGNLKIIVAGDAQAIEPSLRAAGFTDLKKISAKDLH